MYSGEEILKILVEENYIINTFEKKKTEFRERTEKTGSINFSDVFNGQLNQYIQRITRFQNITNDIYKFVSENNVNLLDSNDFIFDEFRTFYTTLGSRINTIDVQTEAPITITQRGFRNIEELFNEYKQERG